MSEKQTLVSLTQGFIKIMTDAGGADVDLTAVERVLKTTKRRLYDVVNVLAGVGLVEKSGKSRVRWTAGQRPRIGEPRIDAFERERELDRYIAKVEADLADISHSEFFKKFGWIDKDDVDVIEPDKSIALYSLHGPPSMSIIVHEDESDPSGEGQRFICKVDNPRDGQVQLNAIRMVPL